MLRVVADANVLISAALARSPNAPSVQTLDAAIDPDQLDIKILTPRQLVDRLN